MTISSQTKSQLEPLLQELENQRTATIKKGMLGSRWITVLSCSLGAYSVYTIIFLNDLRASIFTLITSLIIILIVLILQKHYCVKLPRRAYIENYKNSIFKALSPSTLPDLTYFPNKGIPRGRVQASQILPNRIDRYYSQDLFQGLIGDTQISFGEVKAAVQDTYGSQQRTSQILFDGIYFEADFHKHFSTQVTVMPDFAERHFGWLGSKVQAWEGKLIKLENPTFEKHFVVRGADPVEARYILTPALQKRIVHLKNKLETPLALSFYDSKIVLMFERDGRLFEPNLNRPVHDLAQIKQFITDIQLCTSIVNDLDLNTRIWTKE